MKCRFFAGPGSGASMQNAFERTSGWELLCYPLLIGIFFVLYTYPVFEGDFFWHLNTGQWIWEHRALPAADPFSFATASYPEPPGPSRIQIVLTQYWLGQLLFHGLWSAAGYKGIILARAVCYTAILVLVGLWSRRYAKGIIPFAALFVIGAQLLRYSNERPQLFGFVLAALFFFLLERLRTTPAPRFRQLWPLPVLLLAWANVHGSFLLGGAICLLYAGIHLLRSWSGRGAVNRAYVAALLASVAAALANPNLFRGVFDYLGTADLLTARTHEFQSPLKTLFVHHHFDPYWLLAVPTVCVLVAGLRRLAAEHAGLLALLLAFSLSGGRYIPFFLFAFPLVLIYLPKITVPARVEPLLAVGVLLLFLQFNFRSSWQFRESSDFPRQAVAVLQGVQSSGRVFNHAAWGGYISHFAPGWQVFLDGRLLAVEALRDYAAALNATGWQELFARHRIDTVLLPARRLDLQTMQYGQPAPLVEALLASREWRLLYRDQVAVLLVRIPPADRPAAAASNRDG